MFGDVGVMLRLVAAAFLVMTVAISFREEDREMKRRCPPTDDE